MAVLRGLLETGLAAHKTEVFKEVVAAFTLSDATGPAAKALLAAAETAGDADGGERARTCLNEAGREREVRGSWCSGARVARTETCCAARARVIRSS